MLTLVREELSTFMEKSMREVLQKYSAAPAPPALPKMQVVVEEESKVAEINNDAAVHEGVTCTFC